MLLLLLALCCFCCWKQQPAVLVGGGSGSTIAGVIGMLLLVAMPKVKIVFKKTFIKFPNFYNVLINY